MNQKEKILITGAAGFIGFHTCQKLLNASHEVIGIDNLNDYYSTSLKRSRLTENKSEENSIKQDKEVTKNNSEKEEKVHSEAS